MAEGRRLMNGKAAPDEAVQTQHVDAEPMQNADTVRVPTTSLAAPKKGGGPDTKKEISQRDRVIQQQRAEIEDWKQRASRIEEEHQRALANLTAMTLLLQKRDDVIALQAALTERLLDVYRPDLVAFVQQQIIEMNVRLQAQSRAASEEAEAVQSENRA